MELKYFDAHECHINQPNDGLELCVEAPRGSHRMELVVRNSVRVSVFHNKELNKVCVLFNVEDLIADGYLDNRYMEVVGPLVFDSDTMEAPCTI
jgi:hypothetical protein